MKIKYLILFVIGFVSLAYSQDTIQVYSEYLNYRPIRVFYEGSLGVIDKGEWFETVTSADSFARSYLNSKANVDKNKNLIFSKYIIQDQRDNSKLEYITHPIADTSGNANDTLLIINTTLWDYISGTLEPILTIGNFNAGNTNVFHDSTNNIAIGFYNDLTMSSLAFGSANISNYHSYGFGSANTSDTNSYGFGIANTSNNNSWGFGSYNTSNNYSWGFGNANTSNNNSYGFGSYNTSNNNSYGFGSSNTSDTNSYGFGYANTSNNNSIAFGINNIINDHRVFFGFNNYGIAIDYLGNRKDTATTLNISSKSLTWNGDTIQVKHCHSAILLLTQTSTNAPTVTTIYNDLGDITASYSTTGDYILTSSGLFDTLKTYLSITNNLGLQGNTFSIPTIKYIDNSDIEILTQTGDISIPNFSNSDNLLNNTTIRIEVYY